jgi:hypothetical protein
MSAALTWSRMARWRAALSRWAASRRSAVALSNAAPPVSRRGRLHFAGAQPVQQFHFQVVVSLAQRDLPFAVELGVVAAAW